MPDLALRKPGIGDAHRELALAIHRVAGVDGEVEDRIFELIGIDPDRPDIGLAFDLHLDPFADRAVEQVAHLAQQLPRLDRAWQQGLGPGEGQQPAGERSRAIGAFERAVDMARSFLRLFLDAALGHFEAAQHHREHIVEIVRDAAGKLADSLHLLELAQLGFGGGAGLAFLDQAEIGVAQFRGPLDHGLFEPLRAIGFDVGDLARDPALGERGRHQPAERDHR